MKRGPIRSTALVIGSAGVLASCSLVGHSFFIPSCANWPTLKPGNHIKVQEPAGTIQRGDFVIFHPPPSPTGLAGPKDVVMRVVGLPRETIASFDGDVMINGQRLAEPYLPGGTMTNNLGPQVVPPGEYFVMGDNRTDAADSRSYGPIPQTSIIGRMTGFTSKHVDSSNGCRGT